MQATNQLAALAYFNSLQNGRQVRSCILTFPGSRWRITTIRRQQRSGQCTYRRFAAALAHSNVSADAHKLQDCRGIRYSGYLGIKAPKGALHVQTHGSRMVNDYESAANVRPLDTENNHDRQHIHSGT